MVPRILPRALVAILMALAASAPLAADGPAPTIVEEVTAAVADGALTVEGTVDWGGQAPVVLGNDPTGDAPGNAPGQLGIDLTSLAAWVEDGDVPVATFAWRLAQFDQPPPPEIVRYYWQFEVNGASHALQAKTSDVASGANLHGTPEGIAGSLASYAEHVAGTGTLPQFRIRGNCGAVAANITNCPHVAWASGEFDTDANEIRFHLPLDSDATPAIRPGATVSPTDGAWASLQATVDNTYTRDSVGQTGMYAIPIRSASAALHDASGTVASTNLSVGDEGAVTGSIDLAGVPAGDYTLAVTACFAGSCGTRDVPVTVG